MMLAYDYVRKKRKIFDNNLWKIPKAACECIKIEVHKYKNLEILYVFFLILIISFMCELYIFINVL